MVSCLAEVYGKYKSEQYILNGGTVNQTTITNEEKRLYSNFKLNSKSYNPKLTDAENYQIFKTAYADQIANVKPELIKKDLIEYRAVLRKLDKNPGVLYLAKTRLGEVTNSDIKFKEYFKSFPAYVVFDGTEQSVFPSDIKESPYISRITSQAYIIEPDPPNVVLDENGIQNPPEIDDSRAFQAYNTDNEDSIYLAFTGDYLNSRIAAWQANKTLVARSLYYIAGLTLIMLLAFIFRILSIRKRSEEEQSLEPNFVDRIYNDIKIILAIGLVFLWIIFIEQTNSFENNGLAFTFTMLFAGLFLPLLLSLVKHIKNRTFFKHSVIYTVFHKLFCFARDVYNGGSLVTKVVLIVIGYPLLAALTFFMFPVTLGLAAWIALKRVKEFNAIKEGVKQVKEGDIGHTIDIPGDGEFARLAADINSITDGLGKAVENGVKSERLKSELISNVSHDIRTPLTSIITYVDLLKKEQEPAKIAEYTEVLDQKAQRLKQLTDDLFEAAKATSGSIPVCFENIEIIALLKQGMGETDDKIRERRLDFKLNHGQDRLYVRADGKLLWRAIENLFSNILKYA